MNSAFTLFKQGANIQASGQRSYYPCPKLSHPRWKKEVLRKGLNYLMHRATLASPHLRNLLGWMEMCRIATQIIALLTGIKRCSFLPLN